MSVNGNKDLKLVMIVFGIISLILILTMIINFKMIDCIYFCGVLLFAFRYLFLSTK